MVRPVPQAQGSCPRPQHTASQLPPEGPPCSPAELAPPFPQLAIYNVTSQHRWPCDVTTGLTAPSPRSTLTSSA